MSVPASIQSEIAALNTAITAAGDLDSAPQGTLTTLATQAIMLANDTATALEGAAGGLDTWTAPAMAPAMVTGFLGVVGNADAQLSLADLRGVAGRLATNLTNR